MWGSGNWTLALKLRNVEYRACLCHCSMNLIPDVEQASDSLMSGWRYFLLSPRITGAYNSLMKKHMRSTQYYLLIVISEMDRSFQDVFTQTSANTFPVVLSLPAAFSFFALRWFKQTQHYESENVGFWFFISQRHAFGSKISLLQGSWVLSVFATKQNSISLNELSVF